jgi:Fe2+ transport system protein FeoA
VALSTLRRGQRAVVREARLTGKDAELLRAMGLHTDVRVRLCRAGEPCIVAVGSTVGDCGCGSECRIGLARPLAERIFVTIEDSAR